jgi:glutaredoxin
MPQSTRGESALRARRAVVYPARMVDSPVTVYGTDWCHDTQSTRHHLDTLGVQYRYINIERDPQGERWVKLQNDGKRKMPTVDVGGDVLSVPDDGDLEQALRGKGLMS